MTEKNIFAYKLFLSLNISDFNLFLCENCNPFPWKKSPTPSFPATPSKSWGPVKPPLFENLVWGSTPLQKGRGCPLWNLNLLYIFCLSVMCHLLGNFGLNTLASIWMPLRTVPHPDNFWKYHFLEVKDWIV